MTERNHARNFLEINLAMLFMSTSGPFGKFIVLPAPLTIEVRALLAFVFLVVYCKIRGVSFRLNARDRWPIFICCLLMGVHLISYFHALQLSNVAIGMLSLFTYPVMTAFLEPLFLKTRFQKLHLLLGLMVLIGIYLLVPDFNLENSSTVAIGFGLFSALAYAVRNLILKTKVDRYEGSVLMTYQMGVLAVLLLPTYYFYATEEVISYAPALLGLALITTVVGHTMFINCFKHFSLTTVSILSCIQPVYGIIIGAIFLSELPGWRTIFGGFLILASVILESRRSYR
ncbi:DMT family transporter [Pseudozobellia thermophila]|uniref:Threonine/homoserine efflux transporter RhtA n=1 Tax=Pseudozobellia thermophila TaxID=192903 RepID=A0A1M6F5S1_9FLAO|nr:DMT family transporter [Pseudozobellia thermophila]SHI92939.1 Threonine/homoserine efflux transporter RhtA [Pseudozobellia thermophila]